MTEEEKRAEEQNAIEEIEVAFKARQTAFLNVRNRLQTYAELNMNDAVFVEFDFAEARFAKANENCQMLLNEIRRGLR